MVKLYKSNSGDTIVEVLIAIVVLGTVLAGAYLTARSSAANILTARNRGVAVTIAQNQIEQLRNASATVFQSGAPKNYIGKSGPYTTFCFSGGSISTTSCRQAFQANYNVVYTVGITETKYNSTANTYAFSINVSWPKTLTTVNQVQMYYSLEINN